MEITLNLSTFTGVLLDITDTANLFANHNITAASQVNV